MALLRGEDHTLLLWTTLGLILGCSQLEISRDWRRTESCGNLLYMELGSSQNITFTVVAKYHIHKLISKVALPSAVTS